MIYGLGTDICDIRRIAETLARRGDRFAERILGPQELRVFHARRERAEVRSVAYLATRFAAKEAFSKAIGLGMRMPMSWRACELLNGPSGKPEIVLHGELALWFADRGLRAHATVSDERDTAIAFVAVEDTRALPPHGSEPGLPREAHMPSTRAV
jgi:holo-[acyl-carrier protein] synthase